MALVTTLFQNRASLSLGDRIRYTAFIFNSDPEEFDTVTLKADIPSNLVLLPRSVCFTDNSNTFRGYPYTYERGELKIELPPILCGTGIAVSFVCTKKCPDFNIEQYELDVKVEGEKSNIVVAQNLCDCYYEDCYYPSFR